MTKIEFNSFNKDGEINKIIIELMEFLNKNLSEINNKIVKRNRKIDFYDLFSYMLYFNSSTNETHISVNFHFNVANKNFVSISAFINKLCKLDPEIIKNINDNFISFFYTKFNIDTQKITAASDGSSLKLLASLNEKFKLNKNSLYTDANLSCVFDVDNNFPLLMNVYQSFNEVDNLIKQLNDNAISKYNITYITDRGYDNKKLITYYLQNNIHFITRITKNNFFIKTLNNGLTNTKFDITIDEQIYTLQIIKYINIAKPLIDETKEELTASINDIKIKLNNKENLLIKEQAKYNKLHKKNKKNNASLKIETKKKKIKALRIDITKIRALKLLSNNKIKELNKEILDLNNEKKELKQKSKLLEQYEHSDFYIITNNLKYTVDDIKQLYKKRWSVETSFKFDKGVLNLNQMNTQNFNIVKQNVYIMQFIYIMNAFIAKLLKKYVKKGYHLNKTQVFNALHTDIFLILHKLLKAKKLILNNNNIINNIKITKTKGKINKKRKKQINDIKTKNNDTLIIINNYIRDLLYILYTLSNYQNLIKKGFLFYLRIKKRVSNNKFNQRT